MADYLPLVKMSMKGGKWITGTPANPYNLPSVDKVMEKFLYWWWEYNRLQPLWITVWQFLKIVNIVTT